MAFVLVIVSNSSKIFALGDLDLTSSNITSDSFDLNWNAITPDAPSTLDYYEVFKDGTSIATTSSTTYSVTGLSASTAYVMKVDAVVLDESASSSVFKTDNATVTTLTAPVIINITNVTELRNAIENQADGQTWNIAEGEYGLSSFNGITAGCPTSCQTGWYFPITANDITINGAGVGQTVIYGDEFSQNGNWAKQNFVAIFGDNVTINGMTLMNKVQPNKVIEVIGNNSTIKNISVEFNTKVDPSVFDNAMHNMTNDEARQWTGSIYYNDDAGLVQTIQTLENVSIKNGGISSHAPNATINVNNVTLEYSSDIFWINDYRFYNSANSAINGTVDYVYHVNSSLNNIDVVVDSIGDPTTVLGNEVLELDSNISTNKQITLTKAVTFNGNGNTINPTFTKTGNSNNSAIGVQSDNVKINNLVIDGNQGTDLHGINVFRSKNVEINSVTVKNNDGTGLGINGSNVKVTNIITENNGWHGINVDKLDENNNKSHLEILSTSNHQESVNIPDIYVDDLTKGEVVDIDNQYSYLDDKLVTGDRFYKLKLVAPTLVYPANNSSINTNNFWFDWDDVSGASSYEFQASQSSNTDTDGSLIDNVWHGDHQGNEPTTSTAHSVGANGTWFWQARAVDVNGIKGAWSTVWKMIIDMDAPAAPTNLSWTTAKGNVISNGGTTKEVSGTASWDASASSDVDHYIYKYWNAIDGNQYKVGSEYTTNVNGVSLPGTFNQGEGTHYYCVVAVDAAGNESDCSDPFEITYTIDRTAPAAPTILAPVARQWLKSSPILNAWSEVTKDINGDDEEIDHYQIAYNYDDGHTFGGSNTCPGLVMIGVNGFIGCRDVSGTTRPHQPADNEQGGVTIWVRAIDVDGNAGAWSKSVHYYFDKTAPATDINVSSVVDGKFTVSGTATDNLALNRVYVQLVSRITNDRCGGTTLNLITSPFSTSSPWSVDYDISTLKVTGTSTACVDGNFAAHVSVTDMAGNSSTAGWTENFMVTTPENNGGDDNEGGDDNSTTTPPITPTTPASTGGSLLFTASSFSTPTVTPPTDGQVLGATAFQFTKDLKLGSVDDEVKSLQKFLNLKGFTVATSGAGSLGNETRVFGPKTKAALIKYQEANPVILTNVGITNGKGTGNFFSSTRGFVNEVLLNDSVTSAALEN